MSYPDAAWERAMTVQEVMLKALSGELHWFRAAEILGWSPRSLRRWRERYEAQGYRGLVDNGCSARRSTACPPDRLRRCCGCTGNAMRGSMCATFIRLRSASTA